MAATKTRSVQPDNAERWKRLSLILDIKFPECRKISLSQNGEA